MRIYDRVYGEQNIDSNCIVDLLESKAIKRLGKINQYGAIYQIYPQFFTTRREHSIGVMLLLKYLGASIEEQIAGLLHDVPHTAFSHVIDYVFGEKDTEFSYHEVIQKEVLENSDIPEILKKHGLNKDEIFNIHQFSILEKDLPDLCADRVDYILRDLLTYNLLSKSEIKEIMNGLDVYKGEIIFRNLKSAFIMASKSIDANRKIWSSPYQIFIARKLANALKIAMDKKYITLKDLHGTDNQLYRKLNSVSDEEVKENLKWLRANIVVTIDDDDFESKVFTKLRVIDPKIMIDEKIERLSELNKDFSMIKEKYVIEHNKGFCLKVRERIRGEQIQN